jgi:hypothetical protein
MPFSFFGIYRYIWRECVKVQIWIGRDYEKVILCSFLHYFLDLDNVQNKEKSCDSFRYGNMGVWGIDSRSDLTNV